jgi:hypothetical protein
MMLNVVNLHMKLGAAILWQCDYSECLKVAILRIRRDFPATSFQAVHNLHESE